MKNFNKGIFVIVGAIFIHLIIGSIYSWANLNLYLVSYLKYNGNPNITKNDCFFIMPLSILGNSLTVAIGGFLERKFGTRISVSIGLSFILSSMCILYFNNSLIISYISLFIFGLGCGNAYMPPLRLAWKYFPNKKGLISGFIVSAFGFSAVIFNYLSEKIINPEGKPIEGEFFSESISQNILNYYLYAIGIYSILGICGIFLLFSHQELVEVNILKLEFLSKGYNDTSLEKKQSEEPLRLVFKSKRFYLIYFMAFCFMFYPYMITNLAKSFGYFTLNNDSLLLLITLYPLFNGISRFYWGFLQDIFGFKKIYLILIVLGIIVSSTIGIASNNDVIYIIYCLLSANMIGGNFALLPTLISRIYGIRNSSEVYGFIFTNFGLSSIAQPIISKFFLRPEIKHDYIIIFLIGTFFLVISFVCCLFLKEKPFNYQKYLNEENSRMLDKTINN